MSTGREVLDRYGFLFTASDEQIAVLKACEAYQYRRSVRWQPYYDADRLPVGPLLKRFCRKGIPPQFRRWAWFHLAGAEVRRRQHRADYYVQLLTDGHLDSECSHQIKLDLDRTFPRHVWLSGREGQMKLQRVLTAFALHKPDVGYCQSMNYIAAMLLLAMGKDDEAAFWMMVALIDDGILYRDMYSRDLRGCHVELRALQNVLTQKMPLLAKHLEATYTLMSIVATDWFLCLFATVVPCETTYRIWDALFCEGVKVLYRVALAILQMAQPYVMQAVDTGEVAGILKKFTPGLFDRDTLMEIAFNHIGPFSMATITHFRSTQQQQVDRELQEREEQYKARVRLREQAKTASNGSDGSKSSSFSSGGGHAHTVEQPS